MNSPECAITQKAYNACVGNFFRAKLTGLRTQNGTEVSDCSDETELFKECIETVNQKKKEAAAAKK
jgi:hypothetical protein